MEIRNYFVIFNVNHFKKRNFKNIKKFIIYILSSAFILSCSQTSFVTSSNNYLKKAEYNFRYRNLSKAKKYAEKFIEKEPDNFNGYETFLKICLKEEIEPKNIKNYEQKYLKLISQKNLPDSLRLQVKYIFETAMEDSTAEEILDTIITKYPTSNIANQSAQEKAFEYAVMRDDSLRAKGLEKFLQKYEKNK